MPVGPARPIDVVVHFPHSFLSLPPLRSLFLLRFIKCPLNGPIVRPINPFLSTDRPKERTSSPGQSVRRRPSASARATVLAHAIGDDASLLSHTEEVEDTARVAVNGFLPLNALLRRLSWLLLSLRMAIDNVVRVRSTALLYKTRHLCRPREQKNEAGVKCHSSHAWQEERGPVPVHKRHARDTTRASFPLTI